MLYIRNLDGSGWPISYNTLLSLASTHHFSLGPHPSDSRLARRVLALAHRYRTPVTATPPGYSPLPGPLLLFRFRRLPWSPPGPGSSEPSAAPHDFRMFRTAWRESEVCVRLAFHSSLTAARLRTSRRQRIGLYTILSSPILYGICCNKRGPRGNNILRNSCATVCDEGGKWGAQTKVVLANNSTGSCTCASK